MLIGDQRLSYLCVFTVKINTITQVQSPVEAKPHRNYTESDTFPALSNAIPFQSRNAALPLSASHIGVFRTVLVRLQRLARINLWLFRSGEMCHVAKSIETPQCRPQ